MQPLPAAKLPVLLLLSALAILPAASQTAAPQPTPTVAEKVSGLQPRPGLFPLYWDPRAGKLFMALPATDHDFLLLDQLPWGLGSNDIGLDRGQLGQGRLVHFSRVGSKILLVQPNLDYRSSSPDPAERLAVRQSFAESVLWGFKIEAEDPAAATHPALLLVDATDFFLRDAHHVTEALQAAHQGTYRLDLSRSAIALDATKNFPKNTEVEAQLTFTTDGAPTGEFVRDVTPDARAVTVREHTSLIELPDPGYQPRRFDPRAGFFAQRFRDYSVPLGQPLDQKLIVRHRLIKRDPAAPLSEPVAPIVYYVDRGAPEPIRSALVEGASWWSAAFEAAGFKNAFQVKILPADADPMDVRYNIIQWVHRATRGWSYGEAITDPRTGEIIKGQVTLGSLRARQDYRIAEALLAPYAEGKPIPPDMREMVLARTRQLAAHEVGHTLGLQHNFAASSVSQGTSVMDYPHPLVTLDPSGKPSLDHAYTTGVGAWDIAAIRYGYSQFAPGADEPAALDALLKSNESAGLRYLTDADARPLGSLSPYAHLWDNGPDSAAELTRILAVRKAALARFGADAIQPGQPLADLEDTLVPLYLLHRYQTEAVAKSLGGLDYRYAVRGDGSFVTRLLPADAQRKALAALIDTLSPEVLTLPESLLTLFPPRPPEDDRTRESFAAHTGLAFDPLGAVEASANLTASLLFEPSRASRLVEHHAREASQPALEEILATILKATWQAPRQPGLPGQTQFAVDEVILRHLLALATSPEASGQARALARSAATSLEAWLGSQMAAHSDPSDLQAHFAAALATLERFHKDPEKFTLPPALPTPPGQPIGGDDQDVAIR